MDENIAIQDNQNLNDIEQPLFNDINDQLIELPNQFRNKKVLTPITDLEMSEKN